MRRWRKKNGTVWIYWNGKYGICDVKRRTWRICTGTDYIYDTAQRKMRKISAQTGVKYAESNAECANNAKYIILAVKPQMYDVVLKILKM